MKELKGQLKFIYELFLKKQIPMNREEIYQEMINYDPNIITGKTPLQSITRIMNANCIQSDGNVISYKNNKFLFDRIAPQTWIILDEKISTSLSNVISLVDEEDQGQVVEMILRKRKTDPKKRQWVLNNFPDICQRCKRETFYKNNNKMFFEIHHILPLHKGGEDKMENLSKICPTCHREAHYGIKQIKINNKLLDSTYEMIKNKNNKT